MTTYDTSNSFTLSIDTAVSDLQAAANAMTSNTWADFTMPNLSNATLFANSLSQQGILNGFGYEMVLDPVHMVMAMGGTSHTGGTDISGAGGYVYWDDATNTWTRETYLGNSDNAGGGAPLVGHAYYHNAVNPNNGDWYFRHYGSRQVKRRIYGDTGSTSWSDFSTIGEPYANQAAGGLRFYPEMNSGAGGLVFVDVAGAKCSNSAMTSWTDATGTAESGLGNYQNWIAYANSLIYFGGGNSSTKMYSLNASKVVAACADTPAEAGSANTLTIIPHTNGLDLFAFGTSPSSAFYKYTASSNTWSSSLGSHGLSRGTVWAGCPFPSYGVIVFIEFPGSAGTPTCRLYKP